jgi:hypothetical protein
VRLALGTALNSFEVKMRGDVSPLVEIFLWFGFSSLLLLDEQHASNSCFELLFFSYYVDLIAVCLYFHD